MSAHTMDDAIRSLAKNVARVTIEQVAEIVRRHPEKPARVIADAMEATWDEVSDGIADLVMECADETPDSEVHAVRSFAR